MPIVTPKDAEAQRKWVIVDADGQVLGRLASRIASILRGKHKPEFTPHLDVGDHVVVVNAEKVHLTAMLKTHPERVVEWAVQGMLPKNRLGRAMAKKLKVYRGSDHPHAAQKPVALELR